MPTAKRFFIVDLMAMAYRSFFALGASQLSRKDGFPTGAIYGSAAFLNRLLTEEHPDYIAFVTDVPGKTFRHKIYPDYKAHRDEAPQELIQQIPQIFRLVETYGYEVLKMPGYEADDIIGTLATKHSSDKVHIYIVSGDKDYYQLINQKIFLYAPKRNDRVEVVDQEGVFQKFRCRPDQVVDALALIGDKADNVPGVKGIGEKGASELIETYGSLEGIYENLERITAKRQKTGLETCRDAAFLSKTLVTIDCQVPISSRLSQHQCNWRDAARSQQILSFYQEMEFRSLATKVEKDLAPVNSEPEVVHLEASKTKRSIAVADDQQFADFISNLNPDLPISIYPELAGQDIRSKTLVAISVGQGRQHYYYNLAVDEHQRKLRMHYVTALLGDRSLLKIGHGLKQLCHALLNQNKNLVPPFFDLKVLDYLLHPNDNRHSLSEMSDRYLGVTDVNGQEASLLLKLYNPIMKQLISKKMVHLWETIEMPLLTVLARMEYRGVLVDAAYLKDYSKKLGSRIQTLEAKIYRESGREFNINSPKQLGDLLFRELKIHETLGISKIKKTKTGYSTDESVLNTLKGHPLPRLILEYRLLTKLRNTWLDALPSHISAATGRVHTSFRQTVAATGRLSSDRPNLQNIPMRSEEGRLIRKAFKAETDYVLISADYSQVEIRLLAGMAHEEHLMMAFKEGLDIHAATAAKILGIPLNQVTGEMRSRAKAINFGIIYGMGPQRLAMETGTTLTEAKDFIQKYFEAYPGIKVFTESLIHQARSQGFTTTISGRRRPIPGLADGNRAVLARAENIAVNSPIQGSAADLIKLAMIAIDKQLRVQDLKAALILQVHDELVIECHKDHLDQVTTLVQQGMEDAIKFPVPLLVELGYGATWFDAH